MFYIIEIEKDVYIARGKGDLACTLCKANAARYQSSSVAKAQLTRIRRNYPRRGYIDAKIKTVE